MLELQNITKCYGTFTAVNNISFTIDDGEIFGLLGPNGAGKSTIVSMISTVIHPTQGEIIVNNKNIKTNYREIKTMMSVVPQDIALYENLSAKDNLEFFGSLYGLKGKKLKQRIDEVLEIVELKDKAKQDVITFSGGMRRRVNIGVALINKPQILILDEPTVGIDPQSRNHILETVKRLNAERNMTVIYTSHYMEEVELLCKRVAIIDHGNLIALGTKAALKKSINGCDTFTVSYKKIGEEIKNKVQNLPGIKVSEISDVGLKLLIPSKTVNSMDIIEELKGIGLQITSFHYEEVNLESIFLQITGKSLRD